MANAPDGTFFVREREDDNFALTVVFRAKPTHHLLLKTADTGKWTIKGQRCGPFDSMRQLIARLQQPEPTWPVVLQFPVRAGGGGGTGAAAAAAPPPRPSKPTTLQLDMAPPSGAPAPPRWLHGKMSNQKAAKLMVGGPDGTFLVRERGVGTEYALSVMYKGRPTHHMLKHNAATGYWAANGQSTGGTDLVSAVAGLGAVTQSWPVALEHPVPVNEGGGTPPVDWANQQAAGIDL